MSSTELLKKRWIGKDKLLDQIVNSLKNDDDKWIQLIKTIPLTDELVNNRDLRGISLSNMDLSGCKFKNINLQYSDLSSSNCNNSIFINTDLKFSNISNSSLLDADFQTADLRFANLDNIKVNEDTDFGTYFGRQREKRKAEMPLLKYILTQWFIRYTGYKGKIYSERISKTKSDFKDLKKIYRYLRTAFKSIDRGISDYFFYREWHCELKSYSMLNPFKWIGIIWEAISCSGTSPQRFLVFILSIIFSFAFIFNYYSEGIVRSISSGNVSIHNFGEALYFSVITFSTLGYGDFHPDLDNNTGQYLIYACGIETIIGVISMAILTSMFVRFMTKD